MAWIIPLICSLIIPFSVIDLAGWIAQGRYFLEHHELLRNDIFSVLPTSPLVYPSWGISVVYAWIDRWGGLLGVCVFHIIVFLGVLYLVYSNSILALKNPASRTARLSTYAFWIIAAALFDARPSFVALIPFLLSYIQISNIKKLADVRPKLVLRLCGLNVLWVNIHGSFILLEAMFGWKILFLFIDEYSQRERQKLRYFAQAIASFILILFTSLINPFTYRVYPYILETAQKSRARLIHEWYLTTPWATAPVGIFYYLLVIISLFLIFKRSRKPGFWSFLSSPFFLVLLDGLTAIRNATLPFLVLLPAMKEAGFLDRENKTTTDGDADLPRFSNILKIAPFVLLAALSLPGLKPKTLFLLPRDKRETFTKSVVFQTVEKIRASGKTCPIFNDWKIGSFLIMELPNKIFMDSRNIIYSDDEFNAYHDVLKAKSNWEKYLNLHQACFAVLDGDYSHDLVAALKSSGNWRSLGEENGYAVFERL